MAREILSSPDSRAISASISGFIRVKAESMDAARRLLEGNRSYETGGTVEIRELSQE